MLHYKGFIGQVEFDADAGILHGEVIGIRDVVTFAGESVAEVEKAFRESVDDYLNFCKQRGEDPDKPFSGQFVIRIVPALRRRANMLAQASGKSLNAFVAECLGLSVEEKFPQYRDSVATKITRPKSRRMSKGVAQFSSSEITQKLPCRSS